MIRKVLNYKNKRLRNRSKYWEIALGYISKKLRQDMMDTLKANGGVGLAAPQIGVFKRVILIAEPGKKPYFLVNPDITEKSDEKIHSEEGCLSVPGKRGVVERHRDIVVVHFDEHRGDVKAAASGLEATIIQHEIDHLFGILFIDKLMEKR